jgi:hypothetical protein
MDTIRIDGGAPIPGHFTLMENKDGLSDWRFTASGAGAPAVSSEGAPLPVVIEQHDGQTYSGVGQITNTETTMDGTGIRWSSVIVCAGELTRS